jgi:HPt (histidine-containing phosphotransfer) domain-containing protein
VTDPTEQAFQELRREYLTAMPARLNELREDIAGFRAGHRDATDSLKVRLHRLAGSGGSYGFLDLSSIAREAQHWLARHPAPAQADQLETFVDRMAKAVAHAEDELRKGGEAGK